jgi:hypothetical protein
MVLTEKQVATVVADISAKLTDPSFGQVSIGGFVESQPDAARFLTMAVGRKVGAEEAMQAVFHATVLEACFASVGAGPPVATFAALDDVGDGLDEALARAQPALAGYLVANVESPPVRQALARVALCWSAAVVEGAPR